MTRLLTLTATALMTIPAFSQQSSKIIEGNGIAETRDVAVQPFNKIKASGVFEIRLIQGNEEKVQIMADENLQSLFSVKNDGNTLVVEMVKEGERNVKSKNQIIVTVRFKKVQELVLHTVGNVQGEGELKADNLLIISSGVGNIKLHVNTPSLTMKNKNVGDVTLTGKATDASFKTASVGALLAGGLLVETMDIENTGVGQAEVNASKTLTVKDSFLGKVKNKGEATVRKMNRVMI